MKRRGFLKGLFAVPALPIAGALSGKEPENDQEEGFWRPVAPGQGRDYSDVFLVIDASSGATGEINLVCTLKEL